MKGLDSVLEHINSARKRVSRLIISERLPVVKAQGLLGKLVSAKECTEELIESGVEVVYEEEEEKEAISG